MNNNTRQEAVASSPKDTFYWAGWSKYLIHETLNEKLLCAGPQEGSDSQGPFLSSQGG